MEKYVEHFSSAWERLLALQTLANSVGIGKEWAAISAAAPEGFSKETLSDVVLPAVYQAGCAASYNYSIERPDAALLRSVAYGFISAVRQAQGSDEVTQLVEGLNIIFKETMGDDIIQRHINDLRKSLGDVTQYIERLNKALEEAEAKQK